MKEAKVLIGVPSGSTWLADFGMCLMQMVGYLSQPVEGREALQVGIDNPKGSILSRSRQCVVKRALEMEATHILFLDSDMVFPPDVLHKLLAHGERVVAANCVTKGIPAFPTARLKGDGCTGDPLYLDKDSVGLHPVWRVGTGVMLIETSVFLEIQAPYWPILWKEEVNDYQGEDWTFCERLEEAGIPIFVDLELSKDIGHIGTLTFDWGFVNNPADISDKDPLIYIPD